MTDGQIELANEAASSEGEKNFAQLNELGFDRGRSLVRLVIAGTGVLEQPRRAVLLETAEPLADGGNSCTEEARSGIDTTLFDAFDKSKTMVAGGVSCHAPDRSSERGWP